MGTRAQGGILPETTPLQEKKREWLAIRQFLHNNEYERALITFRQIIVSMEQQPEHVDPTLQAMIIAAQQICATCHECCQALEQQQQACERTVARKNDLQAVLHKMLDQVDLYQGHLPPSRDDSEARLADEPGMEGDGRAIWQRIQSLFNRDPSIKTPPDRPTETHPETVEKITAATPLDDAVTPDLTIYCLGSFRAYLNEIRIDDWHGNNAKAIFKYMMVNRKRPIPIEILMDLFWRDDDPESARRNLYQAVYLLRQALQISPQERPYVLSTNGCYGLNPDLTIWLDSETFAVHYQNGQRLELSKKIPQAMREYEAADALYEGNFLAEDIYEEWPMPQRQQLKNAHLNTLSRLSRHYLGQKNWALGIAYGQKLLQADNCREGAHRRLMRAYVGLGQRHLALRQYHHCVEALQGELGAAPSPQTVELYKKIKHNQFQF